MKQEQYDDIEAFWKDEIFHAFSQLVLWKSIIFPLLSIKQ